MKAARGGLAALLAGAALALATPITAKTPDDIAATLQGRAQAAGFDGAILIGEADGRHSAFVIGANPVRADAVWRWASITKQIAAVIAMQEVSRGRLDLDAPVTRYWPDWRAPHANAIRIRDLLAHRSGLPQPDESKADQDGIPAFYRSAAAAPAESAAGFCAGPPSATPPAPFNYNNCDSIVLAEVLRRVTGQSFEALFRQRIVRKAGLRSAGVYRLGPTPARHVRPIGEQREIDSLIDMGTYGAAGGAFGTIADLWRFDRALLASKLLPARERETMWQSSRETGFHGFFQWIYPVALRGCAKPVRIVERQGLIGGIELRNYLQPESGRALIVFSRKRPTGLGDPWEGKGLSFDLLSAAFCRS